ncbi:MAG: hypothetical protein ACRDCW_05840 [Sarcina sp.]
MKTKAIIATIVIVGIIVIGSIYFMTSTPAHASINSTVGVNSSSTNPTSATPSKINSSNATTNQNNSNATATPSVTASNNNNNNNNNQSNANSPQQSANNTENAPANQSNNNSQQASTPAITSTGNFADIVNGASYMYGTINGVGVVIPLQGGHVVNNLLVLPEYYTSRLNETFTAKIASLGNNNFDLYEYYNGKNTAIYKLKYLTNNGGAPTLGGTFTHTGSNAVTGITFNLINSEYAGPLQAMPFYHTNIAGTSVTIAPSAQNQFQLTEYYAGDSNAFTLKPNYNITNKNYQFGLDETYNGKVTGQYLLNPINGTSNFNGIFIAHPGTSQSKTYNVTLTGSLNP